MRYTAEIRDGERESTWTRRDSGQDTCNVGFKSDMRGDGGQKTAARIDANFGGFSLGFTHDSTDQNTGVHGTRLYSIHAIPDQDG